MASLNSINAPVAAPQTYIVAQNPEVLAHLMKENESRGFCPSAYTTPASVFNTLAVDFDQKDADIPEPLLKTCPIAVQSLKKLDREVNELDTPIKSKTDTLERTPSRSSTGSRTPQMGSLERNNKTGNNSPKMSSLERNAHLINTSHNSLDKTGMFSPKLGSLERKSQNTSPKLGSLERNSHITNQAGIFSPHTGSLERNSHVIYATGGCQTQVTKVYEATQIPNYHPDPVVYQFSSDKNVEESIYDFGGADVKSCAHKQPFYPPKYGPPIVDIKKQQIKVRT